ncbi:ATP-binding cassette sub-family C member 4 isoform X2 [Nematostella vectensis]|uniref:ATP-binding cassette sub-family C member 4 isoform X2 n=1 Tax=Nematostella vectensis TaxID=45351 RepID=UPI0020770F8F|nr:ATP-binding cassette sub-family C member 4 isoform X2 [Nematostella vectensis]
MQGLITRRNWWSAFTFGWVGDLLKKGNTRTICNKDLGDLGEKERARNLTKKLETQWDCEKQRENPRLWKALSRLTSPCEYAFFCFTGCTESLCRISQPIYLAMFLQSLSRMSANDNRWQGMQWALIYLFVMCVNSFVMSWATQQYLFAASHMGMILRVAVTGILYKKVLSMNQKQIGNVTTGHVINLLSNDSRRFDLVCKYLIYVILAPLEILAVAMVMWHMFGVASLAGLPFMGFVIPLALMLGKLSGKLRRCTAEQTDSRLSFISEVISGILLAKMNVWEEPILTEIDKRRRQEMRYVRQTSCICVILEQMYKFSLIFSNCISLVTMVWVGVSLTPVNVFTILSFYVSLRQSVTYYCLLAIRMLFECAASLRRIEQLLDHGVDSFVDKHDQYRLKVIETLNSAFSLEDKPASLDSRSDCAGIEFVDVSSSWGISPKSSLSRLSFRINQGGLLAVTGPIGSGKSTLLLTILHELPKHRGQIWRSGHVSYCPQNPWIFTGTIRENITFGLKFDSLFYKQVVDACALEHDFRFLPERDLTVIGARGMTLSGGQCSRISLARAVYSRASVILLDDPLSRVDAAVGRHVFDRCILKLLGQTTRVVVTHHLKCLKAANHVIVMEDGMIREQGKMEELKCPQLEHWVTEDHEVTEKQEMTSEQYDVSHEHPKQYADEDDVSAASVSWRTYSRYFLAGLPVVGLIVLAALIALTQVSYILTDWWLSRWANLRLADQKKIEPIAIYGALIAITILLAVGHTVMFFVVVLNASQTLHTKMANAVLRVAMNFFHENPTGRILNRFSRDIGIMDEELPRLMLDGIHHTTFVIGVVILSLTANYMVLIAGVPLGLVFGLLSRYYLKTSMEVSRLEAVNRSPVYSHFSATLQGLVTIRTMKMQRRFQETLFRYQDDHSRAWLLLLGCSRWLALRLEFLCVLYVAAIGTGSVLLSTDPALAGLALTYAIQLGGIVQWAVREFTMTQNHMISVQRVLSYTSLPSEPGHESKGTPPRDWPSKGAIRLEDLSLRYKGSTSFALSDINIEVPANGKVGIVGRTGAGKTSILNALMQIEEIQGRIVVDGINTRNINIFKARSCISVIPQNPVVFSGSLRRNLDFFNRLTDEEIWQALSVLQLDSFVKELPGKLQFHLAESGSNLSCGQRQLIGLMRAFLTRNKIVIIDEATANVDMHTERVIQGAIKHAFQDCTLIVIAHRIHTVLECDKVLVMDSGRVVESEPPRDLLDAPDTLFSNLYNLSCHGK